MTNISMTKNEKLILLSLVSGVVVFVSLYKSISFNVNQNKKSHFESVNYKMGQVEESYEGYSLNGRDIERQFESEENQTKNNSAKNDKSVKKDEKKTDADKKKAAAQQQNKKTNSQAQNNKKTSEQNKSNADVVNHDLSNRKAGDENIINYANAYQNEQNNLQNNNETTEKKETKKTLAEVRAWFSAQPSQATIIEIVASYKKGEMSSDVYYAFVKELLTSQNQTYIGFALYGLRATPSSDSFTLNAQVYSSVSSTYQAYIHATLIGYNNSQNVSILSEVIKSKSKVVVLKAVEVIKYGINEIQSGQYTSLIEARNLRSGDAKSEYTLTQYLVLQTALTIALKSQTDSEVVAGLTSIQSLLTQIKA